MGRTHESDDSHQKLRVGITVDHEKQELFKSFNEFLSILFLHIEAGTSLKLLLEIHRTRLDLLLSVYNQCTDLIVLH